MINDIKEGLLNFSQIKGLRRVTWLLLLSGVFLLLFEASTQYFAFSSLHERAEILSKLISIDATEDVASDLKKLNAGLVNDIKSATNDLENPGSYLLTRLLRFFQGAYISLPLFYFLIKLLIWAFKTFEKEMYHFVAGIGAAAFSFSAWLATILGVVSVLWNTSEEYIVSWVLFPLASICILAPFTIWLLILKILVPGNKDNSRPDNVKQVENDNI